MFSVQHTNCPFGYTEYMCNFTDLYKQHPPAIHWWLTGYPIMRLEIGIWIRDILVSIVLPQGNVSQLRIHIYGQHGGPFTNTSESKISNDNGTTTLLLTYNIPWSVSNGNITVNVIVGTSHYKRTFLIDRHSSQFYTILAALLILASILLLTFILYRIKYGRDIPYTRDIE